MQVLKFCIPLRHNTTHLRKLFLPVFLCYDGTLGSPSLGRIKPGQPVDADAVRFEQPLTKNHSLPAFVGYTYTVKMPLPQNVSTPDSDKISVKQEPPSPDQPEPSPSLQGDFEFLNFSHPSQAKTEGARRTVRSHVTRRQHSKEQQAAAAARRFKSETKSEPQSPEATASHPPPLLRTPHQPLSPPSRGDSIIGGHSPLQTTHSDPESLVTSAAGSPLHSPAQTLAAQVDPVQIYPPQWHASIPVVIDHCEPKQISYRTTRCSSSTIQFIPVAALGLRSLRCVPQCVVLSGTSRIVLHVR